MNKLKTKIKNWLIELLGIESIIVNFERTRIRSIKNECDIDEISKQLKALQKLHYVGVDVHFTTNSWAVICIDGKPDFVKFYDLGKQDAKAIRDFLKHFEHSNKNIDAPYAYLDVLKW